MSLSRGILPYLLCIFILFLPLVHLQTGFNPYEYPKFIALLIVSQISFALFLLQGKSLNLSDLVKDRLSTAVLAFVGILFIANIVGINPGNSFTGSVFRYQGFITTLSCLFIFLIFRSLSKQTSKNVYAFFTKWALFSGLIICGIATVQVILHYFFNSSLILYQGRIIGTLGNPNSLAGYAAMILPFALLSKRTNHRYLVLKIVLNLAVVTILVLTQSRSAFFAVVVVYTVFGYISIKHKSLLFILLPIILGTVLTIGLLLFNVSQYRTSIWDNRTLIWTEGIKAVSKRPILGYGQENFEFVFPKERHMKVDNAHNIFIEVAVASGLVGLIAFFYVLYLTFINSSPSIRLSLIAFLVVAQFNPLSIVQLGLLWLLLGFKLDAAAK